MPFFYHNLRIEIIYREDEDNKNNDKIVKGIELKPELNNKAIGTVIPSTITNSRSNKQS